MDAYARRFLFAYEDFGDQFVYHYTNAQALHKIVYSASLRLGPLSQCNDPRERKALFQSWSVRGDPPEVASPQQWKDFTFDIERFLFRSVHIACFTSDMPTSSEEGGFQRGWGRARNWDQYGDHHKGACLVFDRAILEEKVLLWVDNHPGCVAAARFGNVKYRDEPVQVGDERAQGINFNGRSVLQVGARRRAQQLWDTDFESLYLEKATDWSAEREYRIAVRCECASAPTVDIKGALVAVALGEEYGEEDQVLLRERLSRARLLPIAAARLRWAAGAPYADLLPETTRNTSSAASGPLFAWWDDDEVSAPDSD